MTEAIHISGSEGLLTVIPVVLGFHPVDSVVVVGLLGEERRVGPVARINLADYLHDTQKMAEQMTLMMRRHTEQCVLVFYGIQADTAGLDGLLQAAGMQVQDTVFTDNTPHDLNPQVQAESVVLGRVVEIDRQMLRDRVEYNQWIGDDNLGDRSMLYAAMADSHHRDRYLAANMSRARDVLPVLLAACRRVPDPPADASIGQVAMVANLCVSAAIMAYRIGDGAVAQVCLDRAVRVSPHHRLSHLMMSVMATGFPPEDLDRLRQAGDEPVAIPGPVAP